MPAAQRILASKKKRRASSPECARSTMLCTQMVQIKQLKKRLRKVHCLTEINRACDKAYFSKQSCHKSKVRNMQARASYERDCVDVQKSMLLSCSYTCKTGRSINRRQGAGKQDCNTRAFVQVDEGYLACVLKNLADWMSYKSNAMNQSGSAS